MGEAASAMVILSQYYYNVLKAITGRQAANSYGGDFCPVLFWGVSFPESAILHWMNGRAVAWAEQVRLQPRGLQRGAGDFSSSMGATSLPTSLWLNFEKYEQH